jgi:hypothetical protein
LGVYHDNENETLVQLIFRERMNGIILDDLASDMCVRQKKREKQKELEDKGRREREEKKVNIEQTLHLTFTHVFL